MSGESSAALSTLRQAGIALERLRDTEPPFSEQRRVITEALYQVAGVGRTIATLTLTEPPR